MGRRITAAAFALLGAAAALHWFLLVFRVSRWHERITRLNVNGVLIAVAVINLAGLAFLIADRRNQPRWLVIAGVAGHGLSLFWIGFSTAGLLFLEFVFRM